MDKHKILNPCDILTGKVTVDEFAKQFSDKIAEEVTDAMNFKKNDAEKINDFTKWKTGFEKFCWRHNLIPCADNDGNIGLKDSSGYIVRTNWFVSAEQRDVLLRKINCKPSVSFEELYQKEMNAIGP